jgi:hypothetical protein
MIRLASVSVVTVLVAACSSKPRETTVPESVIEPVKAEPADRGELILRSGGKDIGHEKFEMTLDGKWLAVALTAQTTFPDPIAIELAMQVDPATWSMVGYELQIDRGGEKCVARMRAVDDAMELSIEYPDGVTKVVAREGREHAGWFIAIRPTITQTAICAISDDQPHAMDSFAPWYVVRAAPRVASAVPTADGTGVLDLVKVDELIDVYCEGDRLAIVHYPAHAFIAARAEYDAAAVKLTAPDPTTELWASELGCPPR